MIEIVSFLQLPGVCGGGQAAFAVPATEDGEVLHGRGFFFKCFIFFLENTIF